MVCYSWGLSLTQLLSEISRALSCRFDKGLVTMFKVAAGMGWPESLPAADGEGTLDYGAVCFFASFILVLNWTLLQVRMS